MIRLKSNTTSSEFFKPRNFEPKEELQSISKTVVESDNYIQEFDKKWQLTKGTAQNQRANMVVQVIRDAVGNIEQIQKVFDYIVAKEVVRVPPSSIIGDILYLLGDDVPQVVLDCILMSRNANVRRVRNIALDTVIRRNLEEPDGQYRLAMTWYARSLLTGDANLRSRMAAPFLGYHLERDAAVPWTETDSTPPVSLGTKYWRGLHIGELHPFQPLPPIIGKPTVRSSSRPLDNALSAAIVSGNVDSIQENLAKYYALPAAECLPTGSLLVEAITVLTDNYKNTDAYFDMLYKGPILPPPFIRAFMFRENYYFPTTPERTLDATLSMLALETKQLIRNNKRIRAEMVVNLMSSADPRIGVEFYLVMHRDGNINTINLHKKVFWMLCEMEADFFPPMGLIKKVADDIKASQGGVPESLRVMSILTQLNKNFEAEAHKEYKMIDVNKGLSTPRYMEAAIQVYFRFHKIEPTMDSIASGSLLRFVGVRPNLFNHRNELALRYKTALFNALHKLGKSELVLEYVDKYPQHFDGDRVDAKLLLSMIKHIDQPDSTVLMPILKRYKFITGYSSRLHRVLRRAKPKTPLIIDMLEQLEKVKLDTPHVSDANQAFVRSFFVEEEPGTFVNRQ
eukprot:gene17409-20768_t